MSIWNKQDWIKDILSKSGTEITEIKEDEETKDIQKMVYYTALPLMMQSEQNATQICTKNIKTEDDLVRISSNNASNNTIFPTENHLYNRLSHHHGQKTAENLVHHPQTQHHHLQTPQISHSSQPQQQLQHTSHHQQQPQQQSQPQPPTKPKFKCEQCNMLFNSKSAHTSHIKSHAKLQVQQQPHGTNGQVIANNVNNSNNNGGGGGGVVAGETVNTTTNLCSSDPYQCDVCKKTFSVPARLVRHYRTHTGERPFKCEFCDKMFSVKENLQVHRRIHTKERPYKCEVCTRAFEHSGKLHRHMRIHTGERPHRCSVCGKTFIQSGQLVIHMRTHTGEKPYKCPVENCGKGFTCSKQLKVHSRTHTGEKPYRCDICKRDFGYNHVLKLHRVQHYGSKCYKCTICYETFKSKKEMEAHIKGHANDDDEEEGVVSGSGDADGSISSYPSPGEMHTKKVNESSLNMSPSSVASTSSSLQSKTNQSPPPRMLETPRESSSEANSDADDLSYYKYSRFQEHSAVNSYNSHPTHFGGGVNPALLAAVSMAASASEMDDIRNMTSTNMNPPSSIRLSSPIRSPPITVTLQHQVQSQPQHHQQPQYNVYEPLAVMRQQGYFAPAPKVEEFRSSINDANEIRKRVEAALAGADPTLLTPPRSSPESPDRSSSPESDSILMSSRDNMSLPLRKRKLYMTKDSDHHQHQNPHDQQHQKDEIPAVMRMSSVIQFAKSS